MKDALIIAFNGGAYGTYLEWVLNTLISKDPIQKPFTALGNSHNSKFGKHLIDMEGFTKYINSNCVYATARVHPKTKKNESIAVNLDHMCNHVDRVLLLYPDRSHQLMCICNYMTKVWSGHYYDGGMSYLNPQDILKNYPVDPNINLKEIPNWIMREHMSFNLFQSWQDQVEWYFPDRWQHPKAKVITTKDLLDDFESTLEKIMYFWNKEKVREIADLRIYHDEMLSMQQHLGKDQLCENIILSLLDQYDSFFWGDICMISQSWIQHQLRNLGYEIRCHDLNDFPQDTSQLKALLYRI
jgi:hypothetical protein